MLCLSFSQRPRWETHSDGRGRALCSVLGSAPGRLKRPRFPGPASTPPCRAPRRLAPPPGVPTRLTRALQEVDDEPEHPPAAPLHSGPSALVRRASGTRSWGHKQKQRQPPRWAQASIRPRSSSLPCLCLSLSWCLSVCLCQSVRSIYRFDAR